MSFVLTDVVGSTELWERVPDVMTVALARHEELVAAAVGAEGGTVLKPRGEGDSTFSVFARATDALRAAYRLQVAMRAERWPPEAVLRVRVAVHTGEAVEGGDDYLGRAVNRVARLRGVAEGGEVIVSAATAVIVRAALPAGCELVDLGAVELRGLEHPEPAFLLAAADLDPVRRPVPVRRPAPAELVEQAGTLVGEDCFDEARRALEQAFVEFRAAGRFVLPPGWRRSCPSFTVAHWATR